MTDSYPVPENPRTGSVAVPASKSEAHRVLICAALAGGRSKIGCKGVSDDVRATAGCLSSLLGPVEVFDDSLTVTGGGAGTGCPLECGESGSTLRFLLPLCGALGREAVFECRGRLPSRPLEPLAGELEKHGMKIRREGGRIIVSGRLTPGDYSLPGDVSSQFISGLLFALPLLEGDSRLAVTGRIESAGYIAMTEAALARSGVKLVKESNNYYIPGRQTYSFPEEAAVEGDWSGAAFFLAAGAFSKHGIRVTGLALPSDQGDSAVAEILERFGAVVTRGVTGGILVRRGTLRGIRIDASEIPDLVPILAVVASAAEGDTVFENAGRLRLKESDRMSGTAEMINALGGNARVSGETLTVRGTRGLRGGRVNSRSDHRLAMSAAAAASVCERPVEVSDPGCVSKSYPDFWDDFNSLEADS